MKYKYRNREFWCRGYYMDTAGKDKQKIAAYIRHQIEEDLIGEQLTMKKKHETHLGVSGSSVSREESPFTGDW